MERKVIEDFDCERDAQVVEGSKSILVRCDDYEREVEIALRTNADGRFVADYLIFRDPQHVAKLLPELAAWAVAGGKGEGGG